MNEPVATSHRRDGGRPAGTVAKRSGARAGSANSLPVPTSAETISAVPDGLGVCAPLAAKGLTPGRVSAKRAESEWTDSRRHSETDLCYPWSARSASARAPFRAAGLGVRREQRAFRKSAQP